MNKVEIIIETKKVYIFYYPSIDRKNSMLCNHMQLIRKHIGLQRLGLIIKIRSKNLQLII